MADDVYTTLLEFVTDAGSANREIKGTTENLKKMEEQVKKTAKVEFKQAPADYVSKFERDIDRLIKRAKEAGIKVSEGLSGKAVAAHGMFSPFNEELLRIHRQLDEIDKSARKLEQSKIIPPSATPSQLARIDPELIQQARSLEEEGAKIGTTFSKSFDQLIAAGYPAIQALKRLENEIKQTTKVAKDNAETEKRRDTEQLKAIATRARLYAREASILRKMSSDIKEQAGIIRNQAAQLQGMSQLALGAGVGVVGGIFAFASKYVRDAKEATATTVAWKAAQESLAKSGQRVGAVLAQEALPLLRLAAETASKAAGFVEKHPELVQAAINIGLVTAGLGAVGLAVSKGIKLYADQLYLSSIPLQLEAGRLQFAAAQEQLVAARLKASTVPGTAIPTGGGGPTAATPSLLASLLAPMALVVVGVIVAKYAVDLTNIVLEKTGAARAIADAQQRILETSRRPYPGIITAARPQGGSSSTSTLDTPTGVRASLGFEAILKAYEDYKRDDLDLVRKHYADREKIVEDSLQAEIRANQQYAGDVRRVNEQRSRSISEATRAYEQASAQAEQQLATERARIVRDGGIEIQRIEESLQENLRKLRLDHEDRLEVLVAARDALGIVKEQERYQSERSEQTRQAQLEIRQRRADLALRLSDLQQQYNTEREQRYLEFKARLVEINANAQQQLKELATRHQEELAQIRQQRVERVKELDNQFREERARRHEYFLDQIRNLDASLLGEAELRKRRQEELIAELDRFLLQYNSRAASIAQASALTAVRAKGGYASYGKYILGDAVGGGRGKIEYVMDGDLTQLAERVLGGQISRDKLAAFFSGGGGGARNNVTYNDARRIDSRISAEDRERLLDDTFSALHTALSGG